MPEGAAPSADFDAICCGIRGWPRMCFYAGCPMPPSRRFSLVLCALGAPAALFGCSAETFEEAVEDVAQCIAATSYLAEGLPSVEHRAELHPRRSSGSPSLLPTGVSESFVLEVGSDAGYFLDTKGTIGQASAEHVCNTEGADFFDVVISTEQEEGDGVILLHSLAGDPDRLVIGVRRPAAARLKSPPKAFWAGATYSVCAEVLSENEEPLYAEDSMAWEADGASLSETEGSCTLLQPSGEGAFTVTMHVGSFTQTIELSADPYPG